VSSQEYLEIFLIDQNGKLLQKSFEGQVSDGQQILSLESSMLKAGTYYYLLKSGSRQELVSFQKL
jgi:hypothetical protein